MPGVGGRVQHPRRAALMALAGPGANFTLMLIAAAVTWGSPQSWTFTRVLTWPRAAFCLTVLAVSLVFMWTQTENPFLYFQF